MEEFIVTNCPALDDQGRCFQGSVLAGTAYKGCEERHDCLIKKIYRIAAGYRSCYGDPIIELLDTSEVK